MSQSMQATGRVRFTLFFFIRVIVLLTGIRIALNSLPRSDSPFCVPCGQKNAIIGRLGAARDSKCNRFQFLKTRFATDSFPKISLETNRKTFLEVFFVRFARFLRECNLANRWFRWLNASWAWRGKKNPRQQICSFFFPSERAKTQQKFFFRFFNFGEGDVKKNIWLNFSSSSSFQTNLSFFF